MYTRYIPQPDGSFQRNRIQEPRKEQDNGHAPIPSVPSPTPERQAVADSCPHCPGRNQTRQTGHCGTKPPVQNVGVARFLKQLLPKDFDAEDLLVVLLLLLMTGDSREEQNSALLTLLLYLFL